MIRLIIPTHLKTLAKVEGEVTLDVKGAPTVASVLDALEQRYPMLCGTIRDHDTHKRRPFLRYFACGKDISLEPADAPLPEPIASGKEPFLIIGSVAGG